MVADATLGYVSRMWDFANIAHFAETTFNYNKNITLIMIEQIQIIKTTDITGTLLNIPLGKTVNCPNAVIPSATVRSTANRLKNLGKGSFLCETCGDGLLITRK